MEREVPLQVLARRRPRYGRLAREDEDPRPVERADEDGRLLEEAALRRRRPRGSARRGRAATRSSGGGSLGSRPAGGGESTIPWVSRKRETSVSGGRAISFWNVSSVHDDLALAAGPCTVARLLPRGLGLLLRLRASRRCARAPARRRCPACRSPCRPARPAICLKSRTERSPTFVPSNFASFVKRTVRIGMFTPTPSVSVPQMTWSRPFCASCSTSRRYFGRSPAWWTPIAEREEAPELLAVGRREADARRDLRGSPRAPPSSRSSRS